MTETVSTEKKNTPPAEAKPAAEKARRRVREMEVMVYDVRHDTPDTTTLFLFAGNEPLEYVAGHFLTIDPHQFAELEHFTAYLEDVKDQKEKPRAYSLASAPHERLLAITIKEEGYISGEESDMKDRPRDFPIPQFIRYCVDDLKAFYYEARMAQRPDGKDREIHDWFWSETAVGALIMALGQRMRIDEDGETRAVAYGIAR